jgi:transcriptional regulator with XRE-family HTH domain
MAQSASLIDELKRFLRAQGITYSALAGRIGISESSVKRMFARRTFSLRRLEQICNAVGIELSDLFDMLAERREYLTELSAEQEHALVAEPKLLLLTYLLINDWPLQAITEQFAIEPTELDGLLVRLHRARIIELLPLQRVRLRTARNFAWRPNGPVQKLLVRQVQHEFLDSSFSSGGEQFRFVGGMLSEAALSQMHHAIDRLAREFDELARRDSSLPLSERRGCGAVFAIRPWEYSVFARLRRNAP